MAHIRQSRPDSGLGFQVKVLETFRFFPLCPEVEPEVGTPGPMRVCVCVCDREKEREGERERERER